MSKILRISTPKNSVMKYINCTSLPLTLIVNTWNNDNIDIIMKRIMSNLIMVMIVSCKAISGPICNENQYKLFRGSFKIEHLKYILNNNCYTTELSKTWPFELGLIRPVDFIN